MKASVELSRRSILRYAKDSRMETISAEEFYEEEGDDEQVAFYLHAAKCPDACDYECNGMRGFDIAEDVRSLWLGRIRSRAS